MRFSEILRESKWYDDSPTVTLYHGTSSAYLDLMRERGVEPPAQNLQEYAEEVLAHYIPREQWTQSLLDDMHQRCIDIRYRSRDADNLETLFLMTEPEGCEGYARSFCQHGGEIAYTVWQSACFFVLGDRADEMSIRDFRANPPLEPRFPEAHPVVLQVEVPREWARFRVDPVVTKERIVAKWRAQESAYVRKFASFEDFANDVLDRVEVRIAETIPWSMVTDVLSYKM